MKGIKEQIDELLKPLKDDTLKNTTYADDVSRLMKAWENDIATLDKMGYPDVAKAFQEYDKFVSSGMLLWGTNVGKAAAQGEVKKRGFNIVLDVILWYTVSWMYNDRNSLEILWYIL